MNPNPKRPPLFALLFMSMFGFIGITVLVFLWTAQGFGAPPLVFKVFGSFIAICFILVGFGGPLNALRKGKSTKHTLFRTDRSGKGEAGGYDCPNCGANVGDAEVSPSGDIKCSYCSNWWNIHGK
jgi:hypothetical protein